MEDCSGILPRFLYIKRSVSLPMQNNAFFEISRIVAVYGGCQHCHHKYVIKFYVGIPNSQRHIEKVSTTFVCRVLESDFK